jgi:hypothetical protein
MMHVLGDEVQNGIRAIDQLPRVLLGMEQSPGHCKDLFSFERKLLVSYD